MGACANFIARFPFVSFAATVVLCVGVGLFCGGGFTALQIVLWGIFDGLFHFHVPWLESIEIGFTVFAVIMGLFAILMLAFSILAESRTRQNIYSGVSCIMGGRLAALFFMTLTYLLNAAWMGITSLVALAIIIHVMLNSVCNVEVFDQQFQYIDTEWGFCLNLSRFGIYRNFTYGLDLNALCDEEEMNTFCNFMKPSELGLRFGIAFAGSFLIVLGLMLYMISLGSHYSRLQTSKEITNYRQEMTLNDASRDNAWM